MKILLIGANGTVGKAVKQELSQRHEIITAGRKSGDFNVNIADSKSIEQLFTKVGQLDAIVCTAGNVHFGPLDQMDENEFAIGLNDKLMGQVNLVQKGINNLNDGGSFSLISGILSEQPIRYGASASMVNAALEGFVRGAAIELPRGIRINLISPTMLLEAIDKYGPYFRGFEPTTGHRVGLAFSRSVEGAETGKIYKVY